jgi:hypothetical protein
MAAFADVRPLWDFPIRAAGALRLRGANVAVRVRETVADRPIDLEIPRIPLGSRWRRGADGRLVYRRAHAPATPRATPAPPH